MSCTRYHRRLFLPGYQFHQRISLCFSYLLQENLHTYFLLYPTILTNSGALHEKTPRRSGVFVKTICSYSDSILMNLRFCGPRCEKETLPSTFANKVWSRPTPTFSPAWNLVPR